ncbi:MAG: DUF4932 domain-containing protein [Elusimicrobiaceae bacterium]|jgi:hypothetical protein|nr:DUF4932 domain-containing protein [Elusimicrobiaceae bacterium]MBT3955598.1 DUF4932 domain-containing protein [Elusimicrobiaceae bacterium]MBT4008639.1 DUF4932 domain-containing protein [Elusimicrobiaceae bacterium]MBT4402753.1 DUF4932 domain-containing protein [Elusimicrobiaceae bacterium]MBT4439612.1 DUF4932 domain-containing protein [Elusimicrobiaceae bacterium]
MKKIVTYLFIVIIVVISTVFLLKNISNKNIHKSEQQYSSWNVEVPEVRELVNILFAITPEGLAGDLKLYRVMDEGLEYREYYKDVLEHFTPFREHPTAKKFKEIVEHGTRDENYFKFNLASFYYSFDGNKIIQKIDRRSGLEKHISGLEDFALKSNFREFYKKHQNFYKKIIQDQKKATPVDKQWSWLESQFSNKIDEYNILISPLVYGFHCTERIENDGHTEIVMSINAPGNLESNIGEDLQRTIFTEIDHNYVNPVSDKYKDDIDIAFKNRKVWVKSDKFNESYGNKGYPLFNEYMTWAVFLLYIHDTSSKQVLLEAEDITIKFMEEKRKLINFGNFYEELLRIYKKKKKGEKISNLYPQIIEWSSKQN